MAFNIHLQPPVSLAVVCPKEVPLLLLITYLYCCFRCWWGCCAVMQYLVPFLYCNRLAELLYFFFLLSYCCYCFVYLPGSARGISWSKLSLLIF